MLLACAFAGLAGCASMGPPLSSATPEELASQEVRLGVRTLDPDGRFEVLSSSLVGRRLEAQLGDRPLSILALSGGGATGAFGAGALAGLARSGARPEFSVVTGVSAGALVAPFAFLGPAWDAEMSAIYTDGATRGLLRRRMLGAVFGSSVYSGTPLSRLIDRYADDGMIAAVAAEEEILILADEIYEKLVYEGAEHVSIASLGPEYYDLTITVNGFSKAYAMTGWRLGYLGAPEPIARAIDSIQSHVTSNPCSFAQKGALAALKGDQQTISDMREEFDLRRQYMADRLSKIPNLSIVRPFGAFYVLANIGRLGLTSQNFADRLLSKANVVVVPGIAFGNDRTIRFSYATSLDIINRGMDRFEDFCRTV